MGVAVVVVVLTLLGVVKATVFTLENHCAETVWPGVLGGAGGGSPADGVALPSGGSTTVTVPSGWSGRFWGRTGCTFDSSGAGTCATGDCGRGLSCGGAGGAPPVTLAEFTIGGSGGKDFYDVSLVDGFNVAMAVTPRGGTGDCRSAACAADLRQSCPPALASVGAGGNVVACKSACDAFGEPSYCCTGAFASPNSCFPNQYSQAFKAACPGAYSYAYDDATSTFTCSASDYTVTFCP